MNIFAPSPSPVRAVQFTHELVRILQIPRRLWTEEMSNSLAEELTQALRKASGTMSLRGIQAQALYDAWQNKGLFGPIRVGGGKTLISLVVAFVLAARRPLLLLPAKLIEKTKREQMVLAQHWPIPNFVRIMSYESLGRAQHQNDLDHFQPDLIVADEAHKLKNRKAAVTKRVDRYMKAHPATMFVAMSGTITTRSMRDYAHIASWCLKPDKTPIPHTYSELDDWADALDEKPGKEEQPCHIGALEQLCTPQERCAGLDVMTVRRAFRRRLVETPGVVATTEGHVGCSLTIESIECDVSHDVDEAFRKLRDDMLTPDDWELFDPLTVWRHARELALGFYNVWDPRPPQDWLDARSAWAKISGYILRSNHRRLDSYKQVREAVIAGHYAEATPLYRAWKELEASFTPNTVPVWIDDSVLGLVQRWISKGPGIIWTEHVPFANKLASLSGLSYYGRGGLDAKGRSIESANGDESVIASIASNSEGRNLQHAFSRNLVTSPPPNGRQWEQLLGRTHRDGQTADEVTFDVVNTCLEHVGALWQAQNDARYIEASTGQAQKILYADIIFPTPDEIMFRTGKRWSR